MGSAWENPPDAGLQDLLFIWSNLDQEQGTDQSKSMQQLLDVFFAGIADGIGFVQRANQLEKCIMVTS